MSDAYQDGYKFGYDSMGDVYNNALAHQAGGMLSRGDTQGAQNALFKGGQLDEGYKLQDRQTAQRKAKAESAAKFAGGLRKTYEHAKAQGMADQDAYAYAWQAGETYAPQLGITPDIVAGGRDHYAQDPGGFIAALTDKAEQELQFFQTDQGILAGDKNTGQVGMAYGMTKAPPSPPAGLMLDASGNRVLDQQYIESQRQIYENRAAANARHRAPPRPRSGGGGNGGHYGATPHGPVVNVDPSQVKWN